LLARESLRQKGWRRWGPPNFSSFSLSFQRSLLACCTSACSTLKASASRRGQLCESFDTSCTRSAIVALCKRLAILGLWTACCHGTTWQKPQPLHRL
jgi:hypothetical protein